MSEPRSALRVADVVTIKELVTEVNVVLAQLLGQDRRRWNVEPSRKPVTTWTASATVTEGDMVCLVDTTAGSVTLTLPTAASVKGLTFTFKKLVAANNMIADGNGAETIDGAATQTIATQWAVFRLLSTGSSWVLL